MNKIKIKSWGQFFEKQVELFTEDDFEEGMIPRGTGLTYNNISFSDKVAVVKDDRNKILNLNKESMSISVSARATLEEIIDVILPKNMFLPVVPGTKKITVGGAIASNIHGKNHHVLGSFCDHVNSITVILPSSEKRIIKNTDMDFLDFCGGFGVTGLIIEANLKLISLECGEGNVPVFSSKKTPTSNLEETMKMLIESKSDYTVAWLDSSAKKNKLGRGLFIEGDWYESSRKIKEEKKMTIFKFPSFVLSQKITFNLMNKIYYNIHKIKRSKFKEESIDSFLFPLDKMDSWDNAYGETGMVQFQAVSTSNFDESYIMIKHLLEELNRINTSSFITVLKRFGDRSNSLFFNKAMNFQVENGYTLAIDLPATERNLDLLRNLEKITLKHNGRLYLAKVPKLFDQEAVLDVTGWGSWLKEMQKKYRIGSESLSDFFKDTNIFSKKTLVLGANSDIYKNILFSSEIKENSFFLFVTRRGVLSEDLSLFLQENEILYEVYSCDLSNSGSVNKFLNELRFDNINSIYYAAGLMDSQVSEDEYKKIIEVNQVSPIKIFNKFIKNGDNKSGTKEIVYFSSVTTMRGKASTLYYSLSKKATEMFLEGVQVKFPEIDVYIPRTGFVESNMTKGMKLPNVLTLKKEVAGALIENRIRNGEIGYIQPQKRWHLVEFILKNIPLFVWRKIDAK